jgi:hypothetical protein
MVKTQRCSPLARMVGATSEFVVSDAGIGLCGTEHAHQSKVGATRRDKQAIARAHRDLSLAKLGYSDLGCYPKLALKDGNETIACWHRGSSKVQKQINWRSRL